jgi:uncharacterized protein (DUF58 family)
MLKDETINPSRTRDGETEDMLPVRGIQSPPTIHRVNRRPLGLAPIRLIGGGFLLALLLAIVFIALGSWPVGIVFLACAVVLVALLLVAVEREPEDPAAQAAIIAAAVQAARAEIERERAFSDQTQSLPVQDPPDAAA